MQIQSNYHILNGCTSCYNSLIFYVWNCKLLNAFRMLGWYISFFYMALIQYIDASELTTVQRQYVYAVQTYFIFGIFLWLCLQCIHFNIDVIIICTLQFALYNWVVLCSLRIVYNTNIEHLSVHIHGIIDPNFFDGNIHNPTDWNISWSIAINHTIPTLLHSYVQVSDISIHFINICSLRLFIRLFYSTCSY